MERRRYSAGDPVIYRKVKHSTSPGRRARSIDPAPRGEEYTYSVDKFWVVVEVRNDDHVLLVTRRGKQNLVQIEDPNLRPARWWEKLFYRSRFPSVDGAVAAGPVDT